MQDERERRSGAARAVKRRSARASLIVLAGMVLLGLVAAWISLREPRSAGSAGPTARPEPARPAVDPEPEARSGRGSTASARATDDPRRFDGRGRIRGVLEARGVDFPRTWTLVLEPDPTLVGAGRAQSRRVEFAAGETRFEVTDVPFGGYRVHAEAARSNGARVSVLLTRDATESNVTLRLAPAGFVDGSVYDDAGRPAEGLEVHVTNERSKTRSTVVVDASGLFIVRDVQDGEYEIRFGEFDAPLVTPGTFTFRAPSLRWRETRLPPTGSAVVTVRDREDRPVARVEVVGEAPPSGSLRMRTGADGSAFARFVIPGRYTVEVHDPEGQVVRGQLDVAANAQSELELRFE